jgi:hypothetical protein
MRLAPFLLLVYPERVLRRTWRAAFRDASMDQKQGSPYLPGKETATDGKASYAMGWNVVGNHVYPVNDLRKHLVTNCWCNPGDDEGIAVHNSLDGREQYERGERKMS